MQKKIPQLDAIRGIAILVVMVHNLHGLARHWFAVSAGETVSKLEKIVRDGVKKRMGAEDSVAGSGEFRNALND